MILDLKFVCRTASTGVLLPPRGEPLIYGLLVATRCLGVLGLFGLLKDGFYLPPLDALGEILLACSVGAQHSLRDVGIEDLRAVTCRLTFDKARYAVGCVAGTHTKGDALSAAALAFLRGSKRALKTMQFGQSGLKRRLALLFLEHANVQQPAH
ncbi:hypothetical protein [Occallatibacter riparius]|uniref:Uncharacterized protein n=1 Tax=Occallatibacter riparius TaxID=1002689 RepID=A0A9J7BL15_9BACT|nr:hypothetical protein [Occallatibacter riparius]UWZ83137.1 hypothetical protein MOP44_21520 [Occallatibacter riparius]